MDEKQVITDLQIVNLNVIFLLNPENYHGDRGVVDYIGSLLEELVWGVKVPSEIFVGIGTIRVFQQVIVDDHFVARKLCSSLFIAGVPIV